MATVLQTKMLHAIATSEFNGVNGGIPDDRFDAFTWINIVVNTPEDKGVFASLINAGLVASNGETVELTDAGFEVFQASLNLEPVEEAEVEETTIEGVKRAPIVMGSTAMQYHLFYSDKLPKNFKTCDVDILCYDRQDADALVAHLRKLETIGRFDLIKEFDIPKFDVGVIVIQNTVSSKIYEIQYLKKQGTSSAMLFDMDHLKVDDYKYMNLDMVLTMKWSHRFLRNSPHFLKTMRHIQFLTKVCGCTIKDENWLDLREKETYDYSHPNLSVKSNEFFNSNVNYIYDHDSIHLAVKHLSAPAYTMYMQDGAEVQCSREKFLNSPRAVKMMGVLEECYVLALERSQIPNNFEIDPKQSFMIALEKVCTSITSGWFREYAYQNYDVLVQMYDGSYVEKFKLALEQGIVKPYKK